MCPIQVVPLPQSAMTKSWQTKLEKFPRQRYVTCPYLTIAGLGKEANPPKKLNLQQMLNSMGEAESVAAD